MPYQNPFLDYYSRRDIQEEIVYNAANREVAPKYNEQFGKRPDIIKYPNDVYELSKNGATSFHASLELWKNPLNLSTELKKHELDSLRIGWDLLIDIDCEYWEYSKIIAHFIVNSLKEHKVNSVSCKFSGNRGFHIGVPFESFPKLINQKQTSLLFPDVARTIMSYLIYHIDLDSRLTNKILSKNIENVRIKTGKSYEELVLKVCHSCNSEIKISDRGFEYICPLCSSAEISNKDELYKKCPKCSKHMEKKDVAQRDRCGNCNSKEFYYKLNLKSIMNIDAIIISPRHLYRMPYSLHEKTGLASLPVNPTEILRFEKNQATIDKIKILKRRFLEKEGVSETDSALLFEEAFGWKTKFIKGEELRSAIGKPVFEKKRQFESLQQALPEELFPPCIKLILNGLGDGKKRALFILINFLSSVGWNYDVIEKKLLEWNEKNKEPLRQNYLLGQLRYHKFLAKKKMPPNCDNDMYYRDIGVKCSENICLKIKNPVNYTLRAARSAKMVKNKTKKQYYL